MSLLSSVKSTLAQMRGEAVTELTLHQDAYRKGLTAGAIVGTIVPQLMTTFAASSTSIGGFGRRVGDIIVQIYNAVFPVFTVVAALLLVIALIMRMTANQQKAQQATSWIIRIIVCFIAVNCIGFIFNVIKNTTSSMGYTASYTP